jgi:monoterpene epsilon-lactone hydrolase
MKIRIYTMALGLGALTAWSGLALTQQASQAPPRIDSNTLDENGTAYITRVVPLPQTVSSQAQAYLTQPIVDPPPNETLSAKRTRTDAYHHKDADAYLALYPVKIAESSIAGVPVHIITPMDPVSADHANRVIVNLHGGGFTTDSGSLTESIPIANLTKTKVVAVLYRLAPEHPFPAAVDDAVTVYKELLKTYQPQHIVIYGASAGAILTAETAVKLKQLGLPLPAALGLFTVSGDLSQVGDTQAIYSVTGLAGRMSIPRQDGRWLTDYVGSTNPKDPVLSPLYADLHGMPPALFLTSTRDMLLSGTTTLHRAFLRVGDDAQLVVFEALNHGFWYDAALPESKEANEIIAHFFDTHLASK